MNDAAERAAIAVRGVIEWLERYAADLTQACPVARCRAKRGAPCEPFADIPPGAVHESRRVLRLLRDDNAIT